MHQTTDLLELLTERRKLAAGSEEAKRVDRQIVERFVQPGLKEDLRRILLKKGRPVDGRFASQCVTELLQTFAQRVLSACPPGLLRVPTRQALLYYVAACLTKILLSYYRTKNRSPKPDEEIEVLAELRQDEFAAECPGGVLEDVLEQLELWDQGNAREQLWAQAIRYYYVVGMRPTQVERQLQATEKMTVRRLGKFLEVSKTSAARLRIEALEELRRLLT